MLDTRWGLVCGALVLSVGCNRTEVNHVGSAALSVQPPAIEFGLTWVGRPQTVQVTVHNDGQVPGSVSVAVVGHFAVDATTLDVPAGGNASLNVTYAPTAEAHDVGRVDMGTMHVALSGDARVMPVCTAAICRDVSFDTLSRSCVSTFSTDGTACHTACTSGTCESGVCHGTFDSCDDGDACTTELCGEASGCSHTPTVCPLPTNPCQTSACDSKTGCGTAAALDGTSCAVDGCASTDVHVCISGQCVVRPRAVNTRCNDTWVSPLMLSRTDQAMAYDSDRQVVVMFGGMSGDPAANTWEWDGTRWTARQIASAPPGASGAPMIYDSARKRMVLFGTWLTQPQTYTFESQTWEFDGTAWQQIITAHRPPALSSQAFAYDSDRKMAVLFGGVGNGYYTQVNDTWEYDGVDWVQRHPAAAPSIRGGVAMVYDAARKKVFLFGGGTDSNMPNGDTWEYDGTNWSQLVLDQSPPARGSNAMVYDSQRQKVVIYGGNLGGTPSEIPGDDTWEWDGTSWAQVNAMGLPGPHFFAIAAYDAARGQMVMHGGGADGELATTSLWDGTTWKSGDPGVVPSPRNCAGVAYDSNRQKLVVFGGGFAGYPLAEGETLEWDGSSWSQVASTGPAPRTQSPLAFDSARNVTVMFGGTTGQSSGADTWEWDGTTWTLHVTAHGPPHRWDHALGYDSKRQRVVLFGGIDELAWANGPMSDTWEYDGTDWVARTPATVPPARHGASMTFDATRGKMVMFGGSSDNGMQGGPTMTAPLGDTWLWDGNDWTLASPATSPPGRDHAAIAFDSKRAVVMMFGGFVEYDALGDQWEWDGTTWSPRTPASEPLPYGGAGMAYDSSRDEFVMFGGGFSVWDGTSDLWLYVPPP